MVRPPILFSRVCIKYLYVALSGVDVCLSCMCVPFGITTVHNIRSLLLLAVDKARALSEVMSYNLYGDAALETKNAESSHSLRGVNSVDDVPEFLKNAQNERKTLKQNLEAHAQVIKAMHNRMHLIRTEGILPTRAQCNTVEPSAKPTPSAAFTQKPTSAGIK